MKKEAIPQLELLLKSVHIPFPISIVEGGATRKESVQNAFLALSDVDKVMIHDGARPFVSDSLINRLIKKQHLIDFCRAI